MCVCAGGIGFEMDFDKTTGAGTLQIEMAPQNPGYHTADVTLGLKLLDGDGMSVAGETTTVTLSPGGSETISLVLEVSREDYERIALEGERARKKTSALISAAITLLIFTVIPLMAPQYLLPPHTWRHWPNQNRCPLIRQPARHHGRRSR